MVDEKKAKKKEKKVSIFDLYKKEKLIKIKDNQGNFSEILVQKLTQKDRSEVVDIFNRRLTEEKNRMTADTITQQNIKNSLSLFNKEQLIGGIIEVERSARGAIADLFPVEGEEELSINARKKKQEEEFKKWGDVRKKQLEEKTKIELEDQLSELRVAALSTIQASFAYDFACISCMCRDPKTKERIFKDYKEVENVIDKKIIERLVAAIEPLRSIENDKTVREVSGDPDFLASGESGKSSTVSPTTTT